MLRGDRFTSSDIEFHGEFQSCSVTETAPALKLYSASPVSQLPVMSTGTTNSARGAELPTPASVTNPPAVSKIEKIAEALIGALEVTRAAPEK